MNRNENSLRQGPKTSQSSSVFAGIVTYNPDLEKLRQNLNAIAPQAPVVICDNGSRSLNELNSLLAEYDNVQLIALQENKGIAFALNTLANAGLDQGYEWMLSLDQDSVSPKHLVSTLQQEADEHCACVAPLIMYRHNESYFEIPDEDVRTVEWVITSACLTRLSVWKEIGGFDPWLFIDKVDYDYCLRAAKAGYTILQTSKVVLMHELGSLHCRSVLGRTVYVTNHSPWRKYYMTRNTLYLQKKLSQGHPWKDIAKLGIKTILYEKGKAENLRAMGQGIRDGLKARKNLALQ